MNDTRPILFWFRRDLRLSDHPGLAAAGATGRPVIPVYVNDAQVATLGAAPKWRLGLGLRAFSDRLDQAGSRLILRRGDAPDVLQALVDETGAGAVWWTRAYDPQAIGRDRVVKAALTERGIDARSFPGHLLFEPWTVQTGAGGCYRVYSPFWRAVNGREVAAPEGVPRLPAPARWPSGDSLPEWRLGRAMRRGAEVVAAHVTPGEAAAQDRLARFIGHGLDAYTTSRDRPDLAATSTLSEYLSLGEIGVRQVWHAGRRSLAEGRAGAETFVKQLVWREFAYHLMYHTPRILTQNWRPDWDRFPWRRGADHPHVRAWCRGQTGVPMVDAAMREMYVTGRMHNRSRMVAASYLTKHLMTHWKIGLDWFADCLIDWDPACNAMGWQWVAGSGPDAAPYFRIFNPEAQRKRHDPDGDYVRRWIAEGQADPPETALAFFQAIPARWNLTAWNTYPAPVMSVSDGRKMALEAYQERDF